MNVEIPVSVGELVDKITILEIKCEKLRGQKRINSTKELTLLTTIFKMLMLTLDQSIIDSLKSVNLSIWSLEDQIRQKEREKDFNSEFNELARSIYRFNDKRASIKRQINLITNSDIIEEKSYSEY